MGEQMNMNKQRAMASKKANSILGCIKHSITSQSKEVIILLYLAAMQRHLECCMQFWATQFKKDVQAGARHSSPWALLPSGSAWELSWALQVLECKANCFHALVWSRDSPACLTLTVGCVPKELYRQCLRALVDTELCRPMSCSMVQILNNSEGSKEVSFQDQAGESKP